MQIILAESSFAVPTEIAIFLACLLVLLMLINEGGKVLDRWRGKPGHPPNDIIDKRVGELEKKFEAEQKANQIHMSERSSHIYEKLDHVTRQLEAKMDVQMEQSQRARQHLQDRIDPISNIVAEMKGRSESFTSAFESFTEVMKANVEASKSTTEVLKALVEQNRK